MWATWDYENNKILIGEQKNKGDDSNDWIPVDKQFTDINLDTHKVQTTFDEENNLITIKSIEKSEAELIEVSLFKLRNIRNNRLASSDWTQVSDSPLSDAKKQEWATYRQSLRDLPSQHQATNNIDDVIFPTYPE
jgi:hypothetical protein